MGSTRVNGGYTRGRTKNAKGLERSQLEVATDRYNITDVQGFNCLNFRCTTPSLKSLQLGLSLCKRS
ncbi:hypothetical protein CLOP_g5275 [Closterium sp. NIES-67]|nr:hypothetical protein CLOP_g5275 [Closterium sp. NIES-67]